MTGLEVVQQLMAEIGPRLGLSEVTEFTEDESWVLIVDDDTIVTADFDPDGSRLVFSCEVAQPPAQNRLAVYEQLLTFNHNWLDTGGLRFSLDGEAGVVVQSFDLPLDEIDIDRVEAALAMFLEQHVVWRARLLDGAGATATSSAPDAPASGPIPGGMIRA